MEEIAVVRKNRRENFMAQFKDDAALGQIIPNVSKELMYEEFGIHVDDAMNCTMPLTFFIGWREFLKYVAQQPSEEFSLDIAGICLEYVTEYSESDKSCNIVPQLIHKKTPIFTRENNVSVPGYKATDDMLVKYNQWRSVNVCEVLDKIETSVLDIIRQEYGIDLMVGAAVIPIMAAVYVAGLQLARETKQTINMYNVFEIDIADGDQVILTPLAMIKQYLKNDTGKHALG